MLAEKKLYKRSSLGKNETTARLLQWFKLFCDANYGGQENYEPSPVSSAKPLPARAAPAPATARRAVDSPARPGGVKVRLPRIF